MPTTGSILIYSQFVQTACVTLTLDKLQYQLKGIRAAAKALGDSTNRELKTVEARFICGCKSEDWEGNKSAMGKVPGSESEGETLKL